ncbi:MAG TPA: hypothetical protein VH477_10735 [Bryobacteraceae bacterium]
MAFLGQNGWSGKRICQPFGSWHMARTGRAVYDGCRIEAAKDVFLYLPETRLVLKVRTVLVMAGAAAVHTNWVARRD